jgi:aminoglycoside phosphotransferase
MSIFNPPSTPQQQAVGAIIAAGNQLFNQFVQTYLRSYNLVWNNPAATADLVVAAMGTQAENIFAKSAAAAAYLNAQGASVPATSPVDASGNHQWLFTTNSDGSMTLAANPAYTPAS